MLVFLYFSSDIHAFFCVFFNWKQLNSNKFKEKEMQGKFIKINNFIAITANSNT
jgi:hypothetical protein